MSIFEEKRALRLAAEKLEFDGEFCKAEIIWQLYRSF